MRGGTAERNDYPDVRSGIIGIMSQKTVIEQMRVRGAAPYVGVSAAPDGQQVPLYSANPDVVRSWLCDE